MSKMAKSPGAKKKKIPAAEADKEIRWRLKELDTVNAELGADYYENSLEQIMARIEKNEEPSRPTTRTQIEKHATHHFRVVLTSL